MATVGLAIFSVFTGLATLWGASLQLADRRFSRAVARSQNFPIRIHRSVSYRDYVKALERLANLINERRRTPDVVVGVHYGGLGPAADIAKNWYRPVRHVETRLEYVDGHAVCREVRLMFDHQDIVGKNVLVVDNNIDSGRTLKMVVDALRDYADDVSACVIYKKRLDAGNFYRPAFVVFVSKRPLARLLK